MSQNFLSGKTGFVSTAAGTYSFGKWELEMKAKMVPVPNFNGAGYEQYVIGLVSGKATITGPYDAGNMVFQVGGTNGPTSTFTQTYAWTLGLGAGITLTFPGWIESIKMSEDVDGAPQVTLTVQSNGAFTAAIA